MKTTYIAKCFYCDIEIEMDTPDFLSDEVICYDCGMSKAGY